MKSIKEKAYNKLIKAEAKYLEENGWKKYDGGGTRTRWKAPTLINIDEVSFRYYNSIFSGDIVFQATAVEMQKDFDFEQNKYKGL